MWSYISTNPADQFTMEDVLPHIGEDTEELRHGVSSALSHFYRGTGNLTVVDKTGSLYVYGWVSREAPSFRSAMPHSEEDRPRNVKRGVRKVLKLTDFQTVTGRHQSPPPYHYLKGKDLNEDVMFSDFSAIEGRVISHMQELASSMPKSIAALSKALHLARLDMLKGFTDVELTHELLRRAKERQHGNRD